MHRGLFGSSKVQYSFINSPRSHKTENATDSLCFFSSFLKLFFITNFSNCCFTIAQCCCGLVQPSGVLLPPIRSPPPSFCMEVNKSLKYGARSLKNWMENHMIPPPWAPCQPAQGHVSLLSDSLGQCHHLIITTMYLHYLLKYLGR